MTIQEAGKILAVLRAAYPHSYKALGDEEAIAAANLWAEMFSEEPYFLVNEAVKALIATRKEGYSPTIGEVKEKLRAITYTDEMTEAEAWSLVYKACSNGYYGFQKEFAKLPPAVQRAVGRAEQLREWSLVDEDTIQHVVRPHFMRIYREVAEKERKTEMMPPSVRNVIARVSAGMAMQGKTAMKELEESNA